MSASDDPDFVAFHPDMKPKNGLQCFMNMDRPCGADCMAFQGDRPEGPDYRGQWANCAILTNLHKGAKHLVILAQGLGTIVKQQQDQVRQNQAASVPPMPGIR